MLFIVNINTAVCHRGNRNGKKAVHTEPAQNNAHFGGATMIGLGLCSAWACLKPIPQIVCTDHAGAPRQFGVVQCDADQWSPLVTGLPGLYDNAASADACRWIIVTNARRIHVKWTHRWKIVKKNQELVFGLKFFQLESENGLLHVKKITTLPTVSFLFCRLKMENFLYSLSSRQMRKKIAKWAGKSLSVENVREWCPKNCIKTPTPPPGAFLMGF